MFRNEKTFVNEKSGAEYYSMSYFEEDPLSDIIGDQFISEVYLNSDGAILLKIYNDDICNFPEIPFSVIEQIQKHYIIISLSSQIKHIDGETFGCLVLKLKDKDSVI